ncbi:MAG: hypothetical protein M3N98_06070, partial [Actinomycetota bacterium]|nr:hypothetical protein [Actinomycetota bacterium]
MTMFDWDSSMVAVPLPRFFSFYQVGWAVVGDDGADQRHRCRTGDGLVHVQVVDPASGGGSARNDVAVYGYVGKCGAAVQIENGTAETRSHAGR